MRMVDGKYDFKVGSGLVGHRARAAVTHPKTGEEILKKNRRIREAQVALLKKARVTWVGVAASETVRCVQRARRRRPRDG